MAEIELQHVPNEIEFACPHCRLSCKTFPASRATVHAMPECAMWRSVSRNPKELLPMFLIRGGVQVVRLNAGGDV